MRKLTRLVTTVLASGLLLAACASGGGTAADSDYVTIRIGATSVPHAEILEHIREDLAAEGVLLDIQEFGDFALVNPALADGSLDANYFQHVPFLNAFVMNTGNEIVYTVRVHIEPIGLYSQELNHPDEIAPGMSIAIPDDPTNGARALLLLESLGLLELADTGDRLATIFDVAANPLDLDIREIQASMLPHTFGDTDLSIINTNFALQAGLDPSTDAIARERPDSPYANVLAVRPENANDPAIEILGRWLTSEKVREFILEQYGGNVVPAF
ncbi:MAG: MetQ/NlpA family ABC transporter substrate-binding protein [Defluviitaleaceae bacterium]|nr:MetQ/NlpA family ABC transporter substrate-binding protein [Defluviitaleaceae bacterium]